MATEYITAEECGRIAGRSARYFRLMAATLPWAHQPNGERTPWYFNKDGLEKWIEAREIPKKERKPCRSTVARTPRIGGDASVSAASNIESPLIQRLKSWRASA